MRHASNLLALGQKVCGFDPDERRRQALSELGGDGAGTAEAAIDGADAAVIASPSGQHLSDLGAAIGAGCHVFVEKPLAHTDEGIEALLDEAEGKDLVVLAGLNQRFNPAVIAARDLIQEGELGRPLWARLISSSYLPDWRPHQDHRTGYAADPLTGGAIFDIIHEFDVANFLFGPAETVAAASRNSGTLDIDSEDCADVILRHESGLQANIHLDYVTRPRRRYVEVAGTEGFLTIDLRARSLDLRNTDDTAKTAKSWETTVDDDYRAEIAQFLKAVENGDDPVCDGREALQILRQVISARRLCGLPQT